MLARGLRLSTHGWAPLMVRYSVASIRWSSRFTIFPGRLSSRWYLRNYRNQFVTLAITFKRPETNMLIPAPTAFSAGPRCSPSFP